MIAIAAVFIGLIFPLAPIAGPQTPSPTIPQSDVQKPVTSEVDVHNFLVMRLRLLKRGTPVEDLKTELTNDIDFGQISEASRDLLRRLLTLYDRALESQQKLTEDQSALQAKADHATEQAITSIGLAVMTSGGSLIPKLLSAIGTSKQADEVAQAQKMRAKSFAVVLGSDISSFEFDLGVLRSQILKDQAVAATDFTTGPDYDSFLAATAVKDEGAKLSGVLAALERSPRLQPAALYLADRFYQTGDARNCRKYAGLAVALSPRILRHDASRAQALAYESDLALRDKDYNAAAELARTGLIDDPAHKGLLYSEAQALALGGKHAEALPLFEKLAILLPGNPVVLYNLACCQVVAAKDLDAALRSLTGSFAAGFTDIAHAKIDPDLEGLRHARHEAFSNLTEMRLECSIGWNLINPDELVLTNTSSFTLTKVEITAVVEVATQTALGGPVVTKPLQRSFELNELAPKAARRFSLLDTTQTAFRSLRVTATGLQGTFEVTRIPADLGLVKATK